MKKEKVSIPVVRRLPRYYRYLSELLKNQVLKTSSYDLSAKMGLTASQIRQDFNCFGGFGQQGYGYNVELLHDKIADILGLTDRKNLVIIGAGNLGSALAKHINFEKRGFNLTGIFDISPDIIGKKINDQVVKDFSLISECFAKNPPNVAVLAVPRNVANQTAEYLVSLGVKGFWNFSNAEINIPGVYFENVHLGDSLMTLSYRISHHKEAKII
jgi:redox-sensing transcriptional repressor